MRPSIVIALIALTLASCNATRPPIDEDAIDSGAVQHHNYRPSGKPNAPAVWEDSIDAGSVQHKNYRPSGPPNPPAVWEDSIDAGRVEKSPAMAGSSGAKLIHAGEAAAR